MAEALNPTSGALLADVEYSSLFKSFLDTWNRDPRAVWSSFSMIIVSEIGDKTFLIAAILAMKQPRPIVFFGAFSALAVMSVLSALLGVMFPTLLPKWLTTLLAALLFFAFGIRMLRDGLKMTGDEMGDEWEEAQREVDQEQDAIENGGGNRMEMRNLEEGENNHHTNGHANSSTTNQKQNWNSSSPSKFKVQSPLRSTASNTSQFKPRNVKDGARNLCSLCVSPIFAQAFVLTFLGEWGDRSQIATIALAAAHNIILVSFGTIVGHALCTGMAVIAGSWIARRISIKHVTLGGATMFLIFGLIYLFESLFGASLDLSPLTASVPTANIPLDQAAKKAVGQATATLSESVSNLAQVPDPFVDLPGR